VEIGNLLMEQHIMVEISQCSGLRCTFSYGSSTYACSISIVVWSFPNDEI
jgi:hypothetical protein